MDTPEESALRTQLTRTALASLVDALASIATGGDELALICASGGDRVCMAACCAVWPPRRRSCPLPANWWRQT